MRGKVRSFRRIAARDGLGAALQETVRAVTPSVNQLPSPHKQRVKFYQKATRQGLAAPLAWSESIKLIRSGFLPQAHYLYDLDEQGTGPYLSDHAESVHAWRINEPHSDLLDDKHRFHALMEERGYQDRAPRLLGTMGQTLDEQHARKILDQEGALVVKAPRGGGGSRVHICHQTPDGYRFDGEQIPARALEKRLQRLEGYLVTEYCQPAEYARELYPRTPNTVRVVTMNPTRGDPFIGAAIHRVGADTTGSVDNFSQGGLAASVDPDGTLGPAVRLRDWEARWTPTHPDTGAPIDGVRIPGWQRIREEILEMARDIPETPYVGWDLIVTGPRDHAVIEANTNTDVDLLQAHEPLLADPEIRSFYADHGIPLGSSPDQHRTPAPGA